MAAVPGVFVALGSNIGEPRRQLVQAISELGRLPGTQVLRRSSLYRTPPWGELDQPDFVNAVAELETTLEPLALLDALLGIERAAGRVRARRWGPRVLDLDLLLFSSERIDLPRLQLPHPRMHERAFVMLPLAEIAPTLRLDPHGCAAEIATTLDAQGIVRLEA
ncbi:2-amino-4-hydroxy-6-hydroxymethyldihydropteridine diphosphokinase [Aquimonas sp.]|jgi:2-amino-4-hydroxy-6-hydroxymethyldihydropteridine diphosphokinase|uniref:2-amino-4-hydroxy-6- hydroxymethyldihydropteridine diphosphokinase n=1 Tax=Aquimonas sp. TaxID=1872588 RepID=UPI0037C16A04